MWAGAQAPVGSRRLFLGRPLRAEDVISTKENQGASVSDSAPRVLVDATAVPADRGGVGRYVDGLIAALGAANADLAVVCQRADAERYGQMAPAATIVPGPTAIAHRPARLAWEQAGLPVVAQQVNAQVLHCPHYTMPVRPGRPVVVTIHDVTFFTQPEVHTAIKGPFFRSAIRNALHRATRCTVPSKATRDELVRVLAADPTMIDVVYHGVDHEAFHVPSEAEKERVRHRLGLRDTPYFAFLGTLEPRKNVPALVRGWVQAFADQPKPPALVLAGGSGWDDDIDLAIAEVPSHMRVLRPGYLRFADLPGYLGGALVVAYPSHGEGFGLPVLEAMACGSPVLTTPRLSLPEVGGDAVAYTEADSDSIAAGLVALANDPERRHRLAVAAVARAAEFTWECSAEAHLAAYARAAAT
ncbi:MAG: glycosyltransferase family 4 protein [Actinobacteria bacterium]|nr:glycosyltransferase family 4 protein [Actinomycetota bacterium]MBI3687853.1 glycosyltransferase family 4 protein [Actinomycetota bacterium]